MKALCGVSVPALFLCLPSVFTACDPTRASLVIGRVAVKLAIQPAVLGGGRKGREGAAEALKRAKAGTGTRVHLWDLTRSLAMAGAVCGRD